jgi:hypothetical protein
MSPVYRTLTRPKLIHGIEWQLYYLLVLGCMTDAFYALWEPRRLLLLPLIYFGPYTLFRWAGKHDPQWSDRRLCATARSSMRRPMRGNGNARRRGAYFSACPSSTPDEEVRR